MVLSRRQPCRQKKQIEGCSKNTWNATKILKIQCALQRVILRCLDQSGHMGTFYSGVLRIDIQGGAVSGCCMRSAWKLQGSLASGPPCQPVALHHDYLRSRSRALGWPSTQIRPLYSVGLACRALRRASRVRRGLPQLQLRTRGVLVSRRPSTPLRDGMLWYAAAGWLDVPCRVLVCVCECV